MSNRTPDLTPYRPFSGRITILQLMAGIAMLSTLLAVLYYGG